MEEGLNVGVNPGVCEPRLLHCFLFIELNLEIIGEVDFTELEDGQGVQLELQEEIGEKCIHEVYSTLTYYT